MLRLKAGAGWSAVGTNSFPDGYYEKKGAIQAFFEALMREYEIDADEKIWILVKHKKQKRRNQSMKKWLCLALALLTLTVCVCRRAAESADWNYDAELRHTPRLRRRGRRCGRARARSTAVTVDVIDINVFSSEDDHLADAARNGA